MVLGLVATSGEQSLITHSKYLPFCTLHGMMSMLPCRTGPRGGFRVWHLQLGLGGMKAPINATNLHHTPLVQHTHNYKPLLTLVNRIARELMPK